jgi:hypothetical protein
MKKIHLLIGLPGSGKSFWLKEHAIQQFVLDDISQTDPTLQKLTAMMHDSSVSDIWISDVNFCNFQTLQKALINLQNIQKKESILFYFVLFKTPMDICKQNVQTRRTFDDRWVDPTIDIFSKTIEKTFSKIEKIFEPSTILSLPWNQHIQHKAIDNQTLFIK